MKKIALIIAGLLTFSAVVLGTLVIKHLPSIKAFTHTVNNLSGNSKSDSVIFDFRVVSDINNAAKKISSINAVWLILNPQQNIVLETVKLINPDAQTILDNLMKDEQRWLLIFQNSNEIRATGGFMGSYSIIEINDGKVLAINTEDIYDADGQFTGFTQAPSGVEKYLSSGKGLRLPDSNWNPDTPSSAEKILPFFALGNKKNISGIVFVNLNFAKNLLNFLGPVELNDYNTIVTKDNIDEVLRNRRDVFFPGSIQKKHMLSQLLTQIRIKVFKLDIKNLINLLNLISLEIQNHNLQFYSNIQEIDSIFERHKMRQTIERKPDSDYVYLVESNVGINKANKDVTRNVKIIKEKQQRIIQVSFENNNKKPSISKLTEITKLDSLIEASVNATAQAKPDNHLAYINYQRILVPENWELNNISYQGKEIEDINEELVTLKDNTKLKQIGFLTTLKEEETATLELRFTTKQDFDAIYIQQQPGISATGYILEYNQNQAEYTLENNMLLSYP
jgi:hypothetical protein